MADSAETVLVTGGLGQIGYYTYQHLKKEYSLVILDNLSNAKYDAPDDVIFVQNDVQNTTRQADSALQRWHLYPSFRASRGILPCGSRTRFLTYELDL